MPGGSHGIHIRVEHDSILLRSAGRSGNYCNSSSDPVSSLHNSVTSMSISKDKQEENLIRRFGNSREQERNVALVLKGALEKEQDKEPSRSFIQTDAVYKPYENGDIAARRPATESADDSSVTTKWLK